jgi:hypothetical protein
MSCKIRKDFFQFSITKGFSGKLKNVSNIDSEFSEARKTLLRSSIFHDYIENLEQENWIEKMGNISL